MVIFAVHLAEEMVQNILQLVHVMTINQINWEFRRIVKERWNPYGRKPQTCASPIH